MVEHAANDAGTWEPDGPMEIDWDRLTIPVKREGSITINQPTQTFEKGQTLRYRQGDVVTEWLIVAVSEPDEDGAVTLTIEEPPNG